MHIDQIRLPQVIVNMIQYDDVYNMMCLRGKFLLAWTCSSSTSRRFSVLFFSDIAMYNTKTILC